MPPYYPLLLNLESRICLVVGAGSVGARKATGLLEAGARVRLVATQVGDEAAELLDREYFELLQEPYRIEHLDSAALAFAATDNRTVNAQIVMDARAQNILVNCADIQQQSIAIGEFIVPATVRRGDLCIAVSTGGASPMLAQRIRAELEEKYGVEYAAYVELLGYMRRYIKERVTDSALRSKALARIVGIGAEAALRILLREAGDLAARDAAKRMVEEVLSGRRE